MGATATFQRATQMQMIYSVAEAAGAAAADTQDVLADLLGAGITTGPLVTALSPAHANQAAARLILWRDLRITIRRTACALGAGATGYCTPFLDANIVGGVVAGNFRVVFNSVKNNNNNTATDIVMIEYRHSVVW